MALDFANGHTARIHRHDLLVEPRKPALIARNQLRIERPLPVTGNAQIELRGLGQNRLLRITVAAVALARRGLAVQMVVDLRVQNALRQSFLQLVRKWHGRRWGSLGAATLVGASAR